MEESNLMEYLPDHWDLLNTVATLKKNLQEKNLVGDFFLSTALSICNVGLSLVPKITQ